MKNSYLGIDPGRSKSGMALVDEQGKIVRLHIAQMTSFADELRSFVADESLSVVIIGNGTNHEAVSAVVRSILPTVSVCLVGEAYSTEEARSLYWRLNPPKGWRKFVPLGLLVPPEALDAYAAVVQIQRYLEQRTEY